MKEFGFLKRLREIAAIMGVLCCLLQASAVFAVPHDAALVAACSREDSSSKAFRAQSAEGPVFSVSAKKDTRRIDSSSVRLSKKTYHYDGKEKKPSVTVKYGGKALKKGRDYTVSYRNNIKRGKAKVVVKAKGKYHGTVTMTFKIK